jgi:shikimate dehydrogenase
MHRAALAVLAQSDPYFLEWHYGAYELQPSELPAGVECFRDKGFRGINLTVPHKIEVLPLLDEIDPIAEKMGAVNTLVFEKGKLSGFNSDGYGIEHAVEQAFGQGLGGRSILILGAGGASRAAAAQCVESGAKSILIANRTIEKAETITRALAGADSEIVAVSIDDAASRVEPGTLVINATSLGLSAEDPIPIEVDDLPEGCFLYDMIYNPAQTPFLQAGLYRGYPVSNGLGMLVHQGVRSLEIWTGCEVSASAMLSACEAALAGRG